MKRLLAFMIAAVLLLLPIASSRAVETGRLSISSEKVGGYVGELVTVQFYLDPNLPDDKKLGSLSGSIKYDSSFVTFGAIDLSGESADRESWMNGNASKFVYNNDPGFIRFAFMDAYGVEKGGFWFEATFRIEKEGATAFVFNGIEYTGIDSSYSAVSYYLEPFSVGGIYTEGRSVPTDAAADETFAPLYPGMPIPPVPTPSESSKPADPSPTPTASAVSTTAASASSKPSGGNGTGNQSSNVSPSGVPETTPGESINPEQTSVTVVDRSPEPSGIAANETDHSAIPKETDGSGEGSVSNSNEPSAGRPIENQSSKPNVLIFTGAMIGAFALIGLGVLLLILILKRRKKDKEQ